MFFVLLLLVTAVLSLLDPCCALSSNLRYIRPRNPAFGRSVSLSERAILHDIENGRYLLNGTSANATIAPVFLTSDKQSYYVVIYVGNTPFRAALDTASSDLWVVASDCATSTCNKVPKYPLGYMSPTFVSVNNNNTAFNVSFADTTSANGFVALESVQYSNLTVANQAFGVVTSSNVALTDDTSGILGLGFPRLSKITLPVQASGVPFNTTPFFVTMAQRGQLDYPLFGLSLPRNTTGSLTFGAVDGSIVTNTSLIEWNEVVTFSPFGSESNTSSYLQWAIILSGLSVNGTGLKPQPTYPNNIMNSSLALFDVGTPGIFGPYQDVSRMYSLIEGSRLVDSSGQWVIPCDANETISFQFGKQNFTLQPTDYLIGPASGDPNLCLSWLQALPPSSDGIDWQLGGAFLQSVYSIFSLGIDTKEPPLIGLYPLRNATAPPQSPDTVMAYFQSASATVPTTLPNSLLSTPSFTTPPYAFNTSVRAPVGKIVSSGLATSTYSAALGTHHANLSGLPTVTPSPTLFTFILTDPAGHVSTSVSTAPVPSVTLGRPIGYHSGTADTHIPISMTMLSGLVAFVVVTFVS